MSQEKREVWWDSQIDNKKRTFNLNIGEVWKYRDLLLMFVKRDFVTFYKQTILGPIWFILQPILMASIYGVIFGRVANFTPNNIPHLLFYLSGLTLWNYFSECFMKISTVLKDNQSIFGKVYFPRVVTPISIVLSNLIKLGIQLCLFIFALIIYQYLGFSSYITWSHLWVIPVIIVCLGLLALGIGLIMASYTIRYRDLIFILPFLQQVILIGTPFLYPIKLVSEKHPLIARTLSLNPLTSLIENFRNLFFDLDYTPDRALLFSFIFSLLLFFLGLIIYNRAEKNFVDTI